MSKQKNSQLLDDALSQKEFLQQEEELLADSTQKNVSTTTPAIAEIEPILSPHQPQKHTVKARSWARRLLIRVGVLLSILLVLGLIGMALYTSFAFQNVTAFQVGARQAVPIYIGGGGIVYPRQQIPVSYAAAGRVIDVIAKVGDQVKANQPLLQLDQSQVNSQINLAANDVAAAQSYLNSVLKCISL